MTWTDYLLVPAGHPTGIALYAALLVRGIWVASYVWFAVAGFKTDWKWGIGNVLFPFLAIAFFYAHPERGRRPGCLWLTGTVLFMLTLFVFRG